ncbi:MAG: DapH/DapD/GlmU-related protein [Promethearchaeota archaeon]
MKLKSKIHPSSIIERTVNLGTENTVEPFVFLRGEIRTGKKCYFSTGCNIQGPAKIGSSVFFGERASVGFPSQRQIIHFQEGKTDSPVAGSAVTKIGNHCIIRTESVIYAGSQIGNNVRMGHNTLIREKVTIGDNTLVGTGVVIDGNTSVGKNVSIQTNVYIPWQTMIEDHVFLGPNSILTNDKYVMRKDYELKGPILRRGVSVGAGAVILPAIEIGSEAVIGAGAVVTKDVPPKAIVYGVPGRIHSSVPDTWKIPME